MNVQIWTDAAQFPEKEYVNGIFVAVHMTLQPKFPGFFVTSAALGSVCIRMFWELIERGDTGRCQVPTHHIPSTPPLIHVHHLTLILTSLPTHHCENPPPISSHLLGTLLFKTYHTSSLKGTVQWELRWVKIGINWTAMKICQVSFIMPQGTPSREEHKHTWRL